MKNKVLVSVYIPQIDESYEIYFPLNKNLANIIDLISKSLSENKINKLNFNNYSFYNRDSSLRYDSDKIVKETNIRNGTRLVLM